jgi:hypothetical protein
VKTFLLVVLFLLVLDSTHSVYDDDDDEERDLASPQQAAITGPGNLLCSEFGNRFRRKTDSVAGRLSPRNLVFATQTSSDTSTSLDSQGNGD